MVLCLDNKYKPVNRFLIDYYKEKENLVGVEIGVFDGEHATNLLETLNIETLYLIDPYEEYKDDVSIVNRKGRIKYFPHEKLPEELKENEKIKLIMKKSKEGLLEISEKVDFVYIDGNHSYEYVKEDIEKGYDILKEGGVLGGHDYVHRHYGVMQAVTEFMQENNIDMWIHVMREGWFFGRQKVVYFSLTVLCISTNSSSTSPSRILSENNTLIICPESRVPT